MQNDGRTLKNKIRGMGLAIDSIAEEMGMSRQGFDYHLNKAKLSEKVFGKLIGILQAHEERLKKEGSQNGTLLKMVTQNINSNVKENSYIEPSFLTEVLDMGKLLQMPLDELLRLQKTVTDIEKLNLIHEVITTKQELEAIKRENELLRENVALLKNRKP